MQEPAAIAEAEQGNWMERGASWTWSDHGSSNSRHTGAGILSDAAAVEQRDSAPDVPLATQLPDQGGADLHV